MKGALSEAMRQHGGVSTMQRRLDRMAPDVAGPSAWDSSETSSVSLSSSDSDAGSQG